MNFMSTQNLLLLLFTAASSAGLMWSLVSFSRAIGSRKWERIDCEITESRVEIRHVKNTRYIPVIKYTYTVKGVPYQGNNLKYGGTWSFESTSYDYCDKYPVGRIAKASVDPGNPKLSVLEPGASLRSYLFIVVSIAFGAAGFIILHN